MKHLGKRPPAKYNFIAYSSATYHFRQSLIEAAEELWGESNKEKMFFTIGDRVRLATKLRISAGEMEEKK